MAHHDEMENPIARARAGMASDRVASRPGRRIARIVVNRTLATTVIHSAGASAKTAASAEQTSATHLRNSNTNDGSRRNSRVPRRAPTASPSNWNGSTSAAR